MLIGDYIVLIKKRKSASVLGNLKYIYNIYVHILFLPLHIVGLRGVRSALDSTIGIAMRHYGNGEHNRNELLSPKNDMWEFPDVLSCCRRTSWRSCSILGTYYTIARCPTPASRAVARVSASVSTLPHPTLFYPYSLIDSIFQILTADHNTHQLVVYDELLYLIYLTLSTSFFLCVFLIKIL